MKRIILSLLAIAICIGKTNAQEQEKRHLLYAGFGFVGTSAVIDVFSDMLATGLTAGGYNKDKTTWSGNFHAGYKYLPSRNIGVGVTYAYSKSSGDIKYNGEKAGSTKTVYNTIAAEFDYRYINRTFFKLYLSVGAGATIYKETYKPVSGENDVTGKAHFNFQVSPIGIRLGNTIGFFAEAGFGYKGIISAGLFADF